MEHVFDERHSGKTRLLKTWVNRLQDQLCSECPPFVNTDSFSEGNVQVLLIIYLSFLFFILWSHIIINIVNCYSDVFQINAIVFLG